MNFFNGFIVEDNREKAGEREKKPGTSVGIVLVTIGPISFKRTDRSVCD